jgi:hypothetical protein
MSILAQQNLMAGPISRAVLELHPHSPIGADDESVDVGWDGYTYGPDTSATPDILGSTPIDERTGPKKGSVINNGSVLDSPEYGPVARLSNEGRTFLGVIGDMLGDPTTQPEWNTEGGGQQMAATFINGSATKSLRDVAVVAGVPIASGGSTTSYDWGNTYGIKNWSNEFGSMQDEFDAAAAAGGGDAFDQFFAQIDGLTAAGAEIAADLSWEIEGADAGVAEIFGQPGTGNQIGLSKLRGMRSGSLI